MNLWNWLTRPWDFGDVVLIGVLVYLIAVGFLIHW